MKGTEPPMCRVHGGSLPQVQAKIAELNERALRETVALYLRQVEDGDVGASQSWRAMIELMKMHELLAGRATGRGEVITVDAIDAEIRRLEEEMAG